MVIPTIAGPRSSEICTAMRLVNDARRRRATSYIGQDFGVVEVGNLEWG